MATRIEKRCITRKGWPRIEKSAFTWMKLEAEGFQGVAGLLYLEKVKSPLVVCCAEQELTIVEDGCYWLQLGPQGDNWWLSVMFNPQKEIIQYYFDITKSNVICGEESFFEDLMLDVVALPDGRNELLDMDELEVALESHAICREEYELACRKAEEIRKGLPEHIDRLGDFCMEVFGALCQPELHKPELCKPKKECKREGK